MTSVVTLRVASALLWISAAGLGAELPDRHQESADHRRYRVPVWPSHLGSRTLRAPRIAHHGPTGSGYFSWCACSRRWLAGSPGMAASLGPFSRWPCFPPELSSGGALLCRIHQYSRWSGRCSSWLVGATSTRRSRNTLNRQANVRARAPGGRVAFIMASRDASAELIQRVGGPGEIRTPDTRFRKPLPQF